MAFTSEQHKKSVSACKYSMHQKQQMRGILAITSYRGMIWFNYCKNNLSIFRSHIQKNISNFHRHSSRLKPALRKPSQQLCFSVIKSKHRYHTFPMWDRCTSQCSSAKYFKSERSFRRGPLLIIHRLGIWMLLLCATTCQIINFHLLLNIPNPTFLARQQTWMETLWCLHLSNHKFFIHIRCYWIVFLQVYATAKRSRVHVHIFDCDINGKTQHNQNFLSFFLQVPEWYKTPCLHTPFADSL